MTAGVWLVPIVVAGLAVFLWAAARLETSLAPRAYDTELSPVEAPDHDAAPDITTPG